MNASKRRFIAALLAAAFVLPFVATATAVPANAQLDPLGGLTLGAAFKVFGDQVKEIEEKAIGGGLLLEVQAGGQIGVLLQQANTTYQADLNLTFDRLDASAQAAVNNIASVVKDYSNQIYGQMADITSRAQTITNTLPLANALPQVGMFGPTWVVQGHAAPVAVEVRGNFVDLGRAGYDPVATINGKNYVAAAKTTQYLRFDIPLAQLAAAPQTVTSNPIVIQIPYHQKVFFFFDKKVVSTFTVPLMVLPVRPGTLTFTTDHTVAGTETQSFTTQEFTQESGDDDIKCGGEHADLAIHQIAPNPGWTVIPSSVTWHIDWSQGDQGVDKDFWLAQNCSTYTTACLCVSTEHHRFGTSGKVHFTVSYSAMRPTTANQHSVQSATLDWSEQKTFAFPAGGTWTASFVQFDGTHYDFNTPFQNAFINVSTAGNVVSIRAVP